MYITNDDLEFLIHLENKLGKQENWSEDVVRLWEVIERLLKQRSAQREKTKEKNREMRKTDKNYGRSKK